MSALAAALLKRAGFVAETYRKVMRNVDLKSSVHPPTLDKRIFISCCNSTSPPGLVEAETVDQWQKSGKYALGWVYLSILLLIFVALMRLYHFFGDTIRTALHKDHHGASTKATPPNRGYELSALETGNSALMLFPHQSSANPTKPSTLDSSISTSWPVNATIALFRLIFYRPLPNLYLGKRVRPIVFPPLGAIAIATIALAFVLCYCLVPQPLYWQSIAFGSPPVAIRSGMLAVAMMPWIVALSMKANYISIITGIGHERLNIFHRWAAYVCLVLSLLHTVPFYIQPIWDQGGAAVFATFIRAQHGYAYGTGIAALVPLGVLCVHSLPVIRTRFYEIFLTVHVPVAVVLLAMLFWHCNNFLTSWNYLFATLAIWLSSYVFRLFYLNWTHPYRPSFLVGEEASVTLMPEDAVKITIPTLRRWKPGQYVYLRMPGVSVFENHPFTVTSLCSKDFLSCYGEDYRDMCLVFRPFGGFTRRVLEKALDNGPWHHYQAFVDGPYGGMRRKLEAFDHVVLIAGGSGITAIVSHLLDLVKRTREGKAVTRSIELVWAMKRPETMEWFKEELRICRESAPPDTMNCHFFITAAKRQNAGDVLGMHPARPMGVELRDKVHDVFNNISNKRASTTSNHRYSAFIRDEAQGDAKKERELREEMNDRLQPLPQAHLKPMRSGSLRSHQSTSTFSHSSTENLLKKDHPESASDREDHHTATDQSSRPGKNVSPDMPGAQRTQAVSVGDQGEGEEKQQKQKQKLHLHLPPNPLVDPAVSPAEQKKFDFGFPATPTEFQKNLMRFAFVPAAVKSRATGWQTEWGRPEMPFLLHDMARGWDQGGRRACVFVCGPPSLRVDVSRTVAEMQTRVMRGRIREIYLHAENYAL